MFDEQSFGLTRFRNFKKTDLPVAFCNHEVNILNMTLTKRLVGGKSKTIITVQSQNNKY